MDGRFGLSVIRHQRSPPAGVGCLPSCKSCFWCCVVCRLQSIACSERRACSPSNCSQVCDAVTRFVTGQYAAYEHYRTCGELWPCTPEPLHRQSEQSPHAVVAWRARQTSRRATAHVGLKSSPRVRLASVSPPSSPSPVPVLDKSIPIPRSGHLLLLLQNACTAFLPRCRFAVSSSPSPPTSLETRLSFHTAFWLHDPLSTAPLYGHRCYEILIVGSACLGLPATCRPFHPSFGSISPGFIHGPIFARLPIALVRARAFLQLLSPILTHFKIIQDISGTLSTSIEFGLRCPYLAQERRLHHLTPRATI